MMERKSVWLKYAEADIAACTALCERYKTFISENKIERESTKAAIRQAEAAGYKPLAQAIAQGRALKPGDKVWADNCGKAVMLVHIGSASLTGGFNILGAHLDSPRLDVKQNPLYEANDLALLDTHYYGGIKTYQWVTVPLALHGTVAKKDGTVLDIAIGEDAGDPVFCVSDLLIHLAYEQMEKNAAKVVEAEALDVLCGNRPIIIDKERAKLPDEEKTEIEQVAGASPIKAFALQLLAEKYGMEEEDFISAELCFVPAGPARDLGFDRSMVIGYGQDDSVCAYTSLEAQLAVENPEKTAVCILVDKEEIGSVGATGMTSKFFENTIREIMELCGLPGELALHRALAASSMLSSDVNSAVDPNYISAFETKNASFCGHGLVFNKFTGSRGKSGANDANAEYVARIRRIMDDAGVQFQFAELGRVGLGGGGTIAYIPAEYGMAVIDSGVSVLSMHAPWEITSKADIYEAYKGYKAFLENA